MIFNSVTYLLFLVIVVSLYWTLPKTARLTMLFFSSILFYGFWKIEFVSLLIFSTTLDYVLAQVIEKQGSQKSKRKYLFVSLAVNLGLLAYFKYLYFIVDNVNTVLDIFGYRIEGIALDIILPLGISFYTFQTISYTIDVYRGFIKPEKNYLLYACYVMFFPQLIAGPILRAKEVIHQLRTRPVFSAYEFGTGIRWILYGLFLKVVLADNIAPSVDEGFAQSINTLSAIDIWTLAFLFGFQIYFDFSAYSHIAVGTARLMGIHFPENYHYPYLATNPREFWRRWHISLSSWIRDYLYLPLAGTNVRDTSTGGLSVATEVNKNRRNLTVALFLTWMIMGLWHGADWSFVIWGTYHASVIMVYRITTKKYIFMKNIWSGVSGWIITISISMLGWIPFRAETAGDTFRMYDRLLDPANYFWLGLRENTYLISFVLLVSVVMVYFIRKYAAERLSHSIYVNLTAESIVFTGVIGLVFIYLRPINQFIYFQF